MTAEQLELGSEWLGVQHHRYAVVVAVPNRPEGAPYALVIECSAATPSDACERARAQVKCDSPYGAAAVAVFTQDEWHTASWRILEGSDVVVATS